MKTLMMFVMLSVTIASRCSQAANWPQYLGPHRNSQSTETGLLRSWPQQGPEVLWTVAVGRGYGGPVVQDRKVYLLDRDDAVGEKLRCFDLADGKELWSYAYDAPASVMFPGSRGVPTVEGGHVYTCGHNGDLYCIDIGTHQPVWKGNVWTDFGGKPPSKGGGFRPGRMEPGAFPIWAITQNPLVYGDLLILASQAPEAGVVAFDKGTGKLHWKTPSLGDVGYVSPSVVKVDGQDHLVMVTPSTNPFASAPGENNLGKVVGIEPLTGKILWQYDKWKCHISVPCAIDAGKNRVLVVGGYELGATMIQVARQENGAYSASAVFTTEEFGDQTKPPILHNGYFYAQFGTNNRRDGLVCMDMDGKVLWKTKRSPSFNKGSMILVDGLILATDGEKSLHLIAPDPQEFKQLAVAELLGDAGTNAEGMAAQVGGRMQNWAPLALSEGKLLVRDHSQMKCVKVAE